MPFDTALREYTLLKLADLGGRADLVIGIPTFNSEQTVAHVFKTIVEGVTTHYKDFKVIVVVSDGGSLDYTREIVQKIKVSGNVHKLVMIYRGLPGKGTSLRAVFEIADRVGAKACAVFDSDLRSITPRWIQSVIDPVINQNYDFVSPYYIRHKYDASITNNVAYALTRALYGKRVRQPIGGDFGFSTKMIRFFTQADVWETDVAKFGIDIWMTTLAINEGMNICEVYLGCKEHDPKDPAASLGPMFRQVVGTLFGMMPKYENAWKSIRGSTPVPLVGTKEPVEPPPIAISVDLLLENFRTGFEHFGALWKTILSPEVYSSVAALCKEGENAYRISADLWVPIVYDFAATYLKWTKDRYKLVEMMTPLYYGRIAGFVMETKDMTSEQAEAVIEKQAVLFEQKKDYLLRRVP